MDKLAKKLKKEFARSPGKTVVLLLMCFVAGYYYVPILWKLFSGNKSTVATENAELPVATSPAPQSIVANSQESKAITASWSHKCVLADPFSQL
jgi:hypothetical protein